MFSTDGLARLQRQRARIGGLRERVLALLIVRDARRRIERPVVRTHLNRAVEERERVVALALRRERLAVLAHHARIVGREQHELAQDFCRFRKVAHLPAQLRLRERGVEIRSARCPICRRGTGLSLALPTASGTVVGLIALVRALEKVEQSRRRCVSVTLTRARESAATFRVASLVERIMANFFALSCCSSDASPRVLQSRTE